jgi:hypothetical protein
MISVNRTGLRYNYIGLVILSATICFATDSCKVYSFKDVSIPPEIKTIRIGFVENRARYVDPQLSPQLTDKFKQKVASQTKLIQVPGDNADYDVTAYVSDYTISTSGVSNQQAATNRLTVTVHLALKNRLNDQKLGTPDFETDISRNIDFPASTALADAESSLTPQLTDQMTDDMFNRLFSNW